MKQPVMLLLLRMSVAVVGVAFVAGCKPKPPVEPTAAAAPADRAEPVTSSASDPRIEACTIRMTAPEAHEWTTWWDPKGVALSGEGPSSAHSFYWASQKEKETLRANKTAMPLDINCSNDGPPGIAVSLAAFSSTEKDVPLGPGTYSIVGKSSGEVRPGQLLAGPLSFNRVMYDATGGSLKLERFNMDGVAGSFVIDAVEEFSRGKPVHLEGRFEIPCRGGMLESECTANKAKATARAAVAGQ